jgi:hypothetical protein
MLDPNPISTTGEVGGIEHRAHGPPPGASTAPGGLLMVPNGSSHGRTLRCPVRDDPTVTLGGTNGT